VGELKCNLTCMHWHRPYAFCMQGLFALANVILKVKRCPIRRVERAKLWHLVAGLTFAIWGITGSW
jgi:hypothetical protein